MGQILMNWEIRPQKTNSFARAGISHYEARWIFDVVDEKFGQFFLLKVYFCSRIPDWLDRSEKGCLSH